MYIQVELKEYRNVSQQQEICAYCSMNKQYVEGVQKWEKTFLIMMESKLPTVFSVYYFMAGVWDNVSTIQRTRGKEVKNGYLTLSGDTPGRTKRTHLFFQEDNHLLLSTCAIGKALFPGIGTLSSWISFEDNLLINSEWLYVESFCAFA